MENSITIHDKKFDLFIDHMTIDLLVRDLATELNQKYAGKTVTLVIVLNGSILFAADLMKYLTIDCEIETIRIHSYDGVKSTEKVNTLIGLKNNLHGKEVLIIEDIVDTGNTIQFLYDLFAVEKPLSMETVTFLFKPNAFQGNLKPKYVAKVIENDFVVGYGLDYLEKGRNLKDIYKLKSA